MNEKKKKFIKSKIESSGINLELNAVKILNENNWECNLDKLFTDDETGTVREIDIVAEKSINLPIDFSDNNALLDKIKEIEGDFADADLCFLREIRVKIHLIISCKYIKNNDKEWIFFSSKEQNVKRLDWILKKFSYPIFQSVFSMGIYTTLSMCKNFREEKCFLAETGQNIKGDKTNIRSALMSVIKYTIFRLRESDKHSFGYIKPRNSKLLRVLLKIPFRIRQLFFSIYKPFYSNAITVPTLHVFYPVVLVDGDLISYNDSTSSIKKEQHVIIKQNYLSRMFLKKGQIEEIGQEHSYKDTLCLYVEFITKEGLEEFINKIEEEVGQITEAVKNAFINNFDELINFKRWELKYGSKKAKSLSFWDKYGELHRKSVERCIIGEEDIKY